MMLQELLMMQEKSDLKILVSILFTDCRTKQGNNGRIRLIKATELELPHYSGYSLIVEPKTVFYNLMNKGKLPLPGEDMEAEMFEMLIDHMEKHGRKQYEISNFAIPGYESIHNLIYWENDTYAGIGAGAHGYLSGTRYSNIGPIKRYMEKMEQGNVRFKIAHRYRTLKQWKRKCFLVYEIAGGVSASIFQEKFGKSLDEVYGEDISKPLSEKDLIEKSGDKYQAYKDWCIQRE